MTPFYRDPVKIYGPPKSIKEDADWEFASDVFAVGSANTNNSFGYLVNKPCVDVKEFMFKNNFPKYALFNIDDQTGIPIDKSLCCTNVNCKICKEFYTAAPVIATGTTGTTGVTV
jgi:hypothetical protein